MNLPLVRIMRLQLLWNGLHFYCSFHAKSLWPVAHCRSYLPGVVGIFLVSKHVLLPVKDTHLTWREISLRNPTFPLSSMAFTQFLRNILSHTLLPQKTARTSVLELNDEGRSFNFSTEIQLVYTKETMTSVKQRPTQLAWVNPSLLWGVKSVKCVSLGTVSAVRCCSEWLRISPCGPERRSDFIQEALRIEIS